MERSIGAADDTVVRADVLEDTTVTEIVQIPSSEAKSAVVHAGLGDGAKLKMFVLTK